MSVGQHELPANHKNTHHAKNLPKKRGSFWIIKTKRMPGLVYGLHNMGYVKMTLKKLSWYQSQFYHDTNHKKKALRKDLLFVVVHYGVEGQI